MQIEKKEGFSLITFDNRPFSNLFKSFLEFEKTNKEENIIIQFSEDVNILKEDFFLFLSIAKQKKENGTSFVIINDEIEVDDFPEYFNIIPTLQEAEDIIEMENIERELGF